MRLLKRPRRPVQRVAGSFWYDRGVPILLGTLGAVTLVLIVFAAAVLLRILPWQ